MIITIMVDEAKVVSGAYVEVVPVEVTEAIEVLGVEMLEEGQEQMGTAKVVKTMQTR